MNFEWKECNSSCIEKVGWSDINTIRIVFHNGGIWDYENAPKSIFNELKNSRSVGVWYRSKIKGKYVSTRRLYEDDFPFNYEMNNKELDIITVYEVYEPYDKTANVDGSTSLGFFSNFHVAKYVEETEATGWMGSLEGIGIKEVKIYTGSLDNYKYYKQEDVRQRALSKLTDEEKKALGF